LKTISPSLKTECNREGAQCAISWLFAQHDSAPKGRSATIK
jgi:hypothetical protein